MFVIIFLALFLFMMYLMITSDRRARTHQLIVNGSPVEGSQVVWAKSWLNKRTGLLNQSLLPHNCALYIEGCRSIHTKGMNFSIDVVFLSRDWQVLAIFEGVAPGRSFVAGPKGSHSVLETASGQARQFFKLEKQHKVKLELIRQFSSSVADTRIPKQLPLPYRARPI